MTIPCHPTMGGRLRLLPRIQELISLASCVWAAGPPPAVLAWTGGLGAGAHALPPECAARRLDPRSPAQQDPGLAAGGRAGLGGTQEGEGGGLWPAALVAARYRGCRGQRQTVCL